MIEILNFADQHPALIATIITSLAGLIWKRNQTLNDTWETLLQLGRQVFPEVLKDSRLYDDTYILVKISDSMWKGLNRLGVKRSPVLEKLVNEAAEHVKAELAAKLTDYHLDAFINAQQKTDEILSQAKVADIVKEAEDKAKDSK